MVSQHDNTIQGSKMSPSNNVWPDRLVATTVVWSERLCILFQLRPQGFID